MNKITNKNLHIYSINNKIYKRTDFKIFKTLLKIFPRLILITKGFSTIVLIKKKYILLYIKILIKNSSFLFNFLVDIAVIDYP